MLTLSGDEPVSAICHTADIELDQQYGENVEVDEEHDVASYGKHSAPQHEMCAILERAALTLDVE